MTSTPHFTRVAQVCVLAALFQSAPLRTFARDRQEAVDDSRNLPCSEHLLSQRKYQGSLPPVSVTVSSDYFTKRLDLLKVEDPEHLEALAYFESLNAKGYDPTILDGWLEALSEGVIVERMPAELVSAYCGPPISRKQITFRRAPASEWQVQVQPHRLAEVTIASGKVVRVRAWHTPAGPRA